MFAFSRYLNFPKAPIWMLDSVLNTSVYLLFIGTANLTNISTLLLGWYDVATSDNIKPTLKQPCMSTLKFTMLNNVESTLSISTMILTTLSKIETTLLFSTSSFIRLIKVETTLWIWSLTKIWKKQKNIFEFF